MRKRSREFATIHRALAIPVFDAAYDLVLRKGYVAVTTAEIAAAAGARKQTIYRWWASKPALVLGALRHRGEVEIDPEFPSDQPLSSFVRRVCAAATRAAPVPRSFIAEAQFDAVLRAEFKARLIERRRDALRLYRRGNRTRETGGVVVQLTASKKAKWRGKMTVSIMF